MNNSRITLEQPDTVLATEKIQERETQLVRIIEAVQDIRDSKSWSTLKTEVFDPLVLTLERELNYEAKKDNPNTNKLNRFAGEMKWAERFADLGKFENVLRVELKQVKTRLHE